MKPINQKIYPLITIVLIFSILIITPIQSAQAATISFTCTADLYTNNAGIGQTATYFLTITNTGSAKMGSANASIPTGYTNLLTSSLQVTQAPAGQTWTASIIALPTETQDGAIQIGGSAQGLTTGQAVTISFTVNNPRTVSDYRWVVCANQNTGTGGHDYDVYVITFYQAITPALLTKLSCYPNTVIKAGEPIFNTAQLTGTTSTATGAVTYTLYAGTYPSGSVVGQSSVAVNSLNLPEIQPSLTAQLTTPGPYYFLATYSGDANNPSAQGMPNAFTVTPNVVSKLVFANIASPQIAGEQFIITITAQDIYGNTVTDYQESTSLTSSGSNLNTNTAAFTNGRCQQTIILTIAATDITLSVNDNVGHSGTSNPFDVKAAAIYKFIYTTGKSQTLNAGQVSSSITLQIQDLYGNPVTTGITTTPTSTSTGGDFFQDPAGSTRITSIAIPYGQSTVSFYYRDTKAGTPTIITSAPNVDPATTQFTINSAAATSILITVPDHATAGQAFNATVSAQDIYGNTVTNYNGAITFSSSDSQATLPADCTLTNGVGTVTFILQASGQQTLTAKDKTSPTITGTTSIYITPAELASITINPKSATILIGQTQDFSVEAYDQYGNSLGDVTTTSTFDAPGTTVIGNSITANTQGTYTITTQYSGKSDTATLTVNPLTPSPTPTPTTTPSPTPTPEPTTTPTPTPQPTTSPTPTPPPTINPTPPPTTTPTPTPTPTINPTPTPTTNPTPNPSQPPNPTPTPIQTPTPTPTISPTPSPNVTPSPTPTANPTSTPTTTPTPSPSTNPTPNPSTNPSPTSTPTPSTNPNPTPSSAPTQTPSYSSNSYPTATSFTLTFKEEGLPTGKLWSITLDGETKSSTTQTITFNTVSPGSHAWTINTKTIAGDATTRYIATTDDSMYLKVQTTTTITVSYVTQYYLTVKSAYGNPVGQGWYDAASTANYMVLSEYTDGISNYIFTTWTGQGSGSYTGIGNIQTVVMNNPITETANWEQQTNLYSIGAAFLIILLLMLLLIFLLVAWRRRKKDKKQPKQAIPENQTQEKPLQYPNFFSQSS